MALPQSKLHPPQDRSGWLDIGGAAIGLLLVSMVGGLLTAHSIDSGWYATLVKSSLNPPNVVFGPVWTSLYVCMFLAYVLAKNGSAKVVTDYKTIFKINLLVNLAWSFVFFGLKSVGAGMAVILIYLCVCVGTAVVFNKYSKAAAWLLVPLILWVSFASYLNFEILRLN